MNIRPGVSEQVDAHADGGRCQPVYWRGQRQHIQGAHDPGTQARARG